MGRPRKGTEETFYDTFAEWDAADQAVALRVLEQLHRQRQREAKRNGTGPSGPQLKLEESDGPTHS